MNDSTDSIDPEIVQAAREAVTELERATQALPATGFSEPFLVQFAFMTPQLRGLFVRFEVRTVDESLWVPYQIESGDRGTSIGSHFDMDMPGVAEERAAVLLAKLLDDARREIWRRPADPPDRMALIRSGRHAQPPAGPDCEQYARGAKWEQVRYEVLYQEENFDRHRLELRHCTHCGQIFVYRYSNAFTFFVRVSEAEADLIREDYDWADAMIQARRHYTIQPRGWGGEAYWSDEAEPELARQPLE